MPIKKYNLTLEEAIVRLEANARKNTEQTEAGTVTHQLDGMSLDQAYDVGYSTLLYDLKSLTGPDPMEVEVRTYAIPEEDHHD